MVDSPRLAETVDRTRDESGADRGSSAAAAPYLFRVVDRERLALPPSRHLLSRLEEIVIGRGERFSARRGGARLELELDDAQVSARHATLRYAQGRFVIDDEQSRNGTRVNGETIQRAVLSEGDWIEIGHSFFLFRSAEAVGNADPDWELTRSPEPLAKATLSPALGSAMEALARVARSMTSVMLVGPTGSGKELAAQALHAWSGRSGKLVAVNCGALSPSLLESELFGHKRGAFSGAVEDRPGFVRAADGGTLFLDEVSALSTAAQTALLRVLEQREVVPVGSATPIPIDLRLCAADQRSLAERVAEGQFRADLSARLGGFDLTLPSLAERREDIGILLAASIRRHAPMHAEALTFTREAMRALLMYDWTLNIRELDRCLEAAIALCQGGRIGVDHLPAALREPRVTKRSARVAEVDDARAQELTRLLTEHRGNVHAVARALGKDPTQIRRWLKRFRLEPDRYRG
jgi:transcriptional regulator of acetoin/glycerol metabolism